MISRILIAIAVVIVSTAIGRGIVLLFGLDRFAAEILQAIATTPLAQGPAWLMSGVFGLICVTAWVATHADERIADFFSVRPALGSLTFQEPFGLHISRNAKTGKTDTEMAVALSNQNDFLVAYTATLSGEVNGKLFQDGSGTADITFEGYAPARGKTSLILKVPDIPAPPPASPSFLLNGRFKYHLTYYSAPKGRRTRKTSKTIQFETLQPLQDIPGTSDGNMNVLFVENREE